VLVSSAVELAGQMPRAPYLMYEGQDEGHESMWDDAATKNYTRLLVKIKDVGGKPLPFPQRQMQEPAIQGLMLLLRMMQELYYSVTGSVSPQMRAVNPYDRSGKAIEALQRQGAAGTSNYLDNLATISMLYEGECYIDAIPQYYDRPGRIVRTLAEESDDEQAIMIRRPFILGPDGIPVAVPCQTCQGQGMILPAIDPMNPELRGSIVCPDCEGGKFATKENMPSEWQGRIVEYVDFADGKFKAQAAVDKNFQVKQEEALAGMSELAQAAPDLVPVYADLWVRAMGFSGSNQIADRIKDRMPGGGDDEELADIPQELQGRFIALKQQHQQAMEALAEAQKMLETDAIKAASAKELESMRSAIKLKIEDMKAQGKMLDVRAAGSQAAQLEMLRGQIKTMHLEMEHRHEIILELLKEQKEKEIERHSVGLHAAAEEAAARSADLRVRAGEARTFARESVSEAVEHDRTTESEAAKAAREAAEADKDRQHEATRAREDFVRGETAAEAAARRERETLKQSQKSTEKKD
jgi:hypothetical protein